jgi:DNA helicase-2/ATP-dependent DNA helicase PcrA
MLLPIASRRVAATEGIIASQMLQVAIYAIAAKKELEYQPEQGLVRYLDADDDRRELDVPLDDASVCGATVLVSETARKIRDRTFKLGPAPQKDGAPRCAKCDFLGLCGMEDAAPHKGPRGRLR